MGIQQRSIGRCYATARRVVFLLLGHPKDLAYIVQQNFEESDQRKLRVPGLCLSARNAGDQRVSIKPQWLPKDLRTDTPHHRGLPMLGVMLPR